MMSNKADDLTQANEKANIDFNGKNVTAGNKPEKAKDTQDANEAANADFNGGTAPDVLGNRVGGLRGSSD
jgi:hypothetical protein